MMTSITPRLLVLMSASLLFFACKPNKPQLRSQANPIPVESLGLSYPIMVADTGTSVFVLDYLPTGVKLDSMRASDGFKVSISGDSSSLNITGGTDKGIGVLSLYTQGYPYEILLRSTRLQALQSDSGSLRLVSKNFKDGTLNIEAVGSASQVLAFWNNEQVALEETAKGQYSLSVPADAKGMKRSWLRVYASDGKAMSNDVLVPLENGEAVVDPKLLTRQDFEAQIMYFPLIDRFNNGNKANDKPINHPKIGPKQNYQGGDIAGITAKIKDGFFDSLSINCIWLSPITQNPEGPYQEFVEPQRWYSGYHGYWPISSSKIDHRFGTDEEMHELVKVAHEHGINVILDYVCNHVHQEHPMFQKHPEWATTLDLPDGRKNIRIWDEFRLTTWFDTFMPTLDLENPEAADVQSDSALFWVEKFNLDGYRHDATKHIPQSFWRTLTNKLRDKIMLPRKQRLYMIGETYGSNELIASYLSNGMMDCQFDFNLFFTTRDALLKPEGSLVDVAKGMRETFHWFGAHNTMGYVSGNHDQPRFMGYAGGDLQFGENDREAGWKREIVIKDNNGYKKMQTMMAFIMSIPGVPVIYYGDEIGMVGANDPDNRRMMRFEGWNALEQETANITRKLTALRKSSMAMMYGDTEILAVDKEYLVFARSYLGQNAIIFINRSGNAVELTAKLKPYLQGKYQARFGSAASVTGAEARATVPAFGFEILTN